MPNQAVARGMWLAVVAAAFGLAALRYPIGDLMHAGPGLFPLIVSGALMVIALLLLAQARMGASPPVQLSMRNLGLVLLGLAGFVVATSSVGAAAGTVVLVFVTSAAGTTYSWHRNALLSAALIAVAFAFDKLLGLTLPLV